MPSKRLRDILNHVRQFYHALAELYEGLSETERDERVKLLLEYMRRHEEQIEKCLDQYEHEAVQGVLDTWVQFAGDEELKRALREIPLHADMTPDELIECSLRFDDALLQLYRDVAESTSVPRVQELFASLAEMEENKDHQYARSLLE